MGWGQGWDGAGRGIHGLDGLWEANSACNTHRIAPSTLTLTNNHHKPHPTNRTQGTPLSPGQTVYLRAPGASLLESHPFTLSDAWEEDDAACGPHVSTLVHIKVTGDWTASLKKLVAAGQGLTLQVSKPRRRWLCNR